MRWTGFGEINEGEVIWLGVEMQLCKGVGFLLRIKAKSTSRIQPNKIKSNLVTIQRNATKHHSNNGICVYKRQR